MVNCSNLTFELKFSHVKAHQDDQYSYETLSRPSQLNCQMDYYAKKAIWEQDREKMRDTPQFPLEPVCVMLGGNKLTSDRGAELKFWIHRQLAREFFHEARWTGRW